MTNEQVAQLIEQMMNNLLQCSQVGNPSPRTVEIANDIYHPQVGDLVIEWTSRSRFAPIERVGVMQSENSILRLDGKTETWNNHVFWKVPVDISAMKLDLIDESKYTAKYQFGIIGVRDDYRLIGIIKVICSLLPKKNGMDDIGLGKAFADNLVKDGVEFWSDPNLSYHRVEELKQQCNTYGIIYNVVRQSE